jgi:putative spermidine/putrescine transport system ATP-binding protein
LRIGGTPLVGELSAEGTVAEVVYVGAATRVMVDLDLGGRLVALKQNTSTEPPARRGQRTRLCWRREHMYRLQGSSQAVAS